MTYTFKLSRRLAMQPAPILVLLAFTSIACSPDETAFSNPINPSDTTVTSVRISPTEVTLELDEVAQFTALGSSSLSTDVAILANWSASGGVMNADGRFSSDVPGTFEIMAQARNSARVADTAVITVAALSLVGMSITPAAATIAPGVSRAFSVVGERSDGSTRPVNVVWSATGGNINPAGIFTAGSTEGVFQVIARHAVSGLADTARISISATPPTVQQVVILPASVSLQVGSSQQFGAYGFMSDGSTAPLAVDYSATGGSVNGGGLYWAGRTAGTYRVIARQAGGGTLADTAVVTISVTPPPGGGLANECNSPQAGWIWCDDFEQDRTQSYFEYSNAGGSFVRASGVGNGGSYGMRAHFAAGQTAAGSLHLAFGKTPQTYMRPVDAGVTVYREIYWRMYLKNASGWIGGGGNKLSRATIFASPTSFAQAMIAHVWSGANTKKNYLAIDPASGTDSQGNLQTTTYNDFANLRWLGAAPGTTPIFDAAHVGRWYCVEAHVRLNDPGQSNGVYEMWIDGAREASRTGLNWVGTYSQYGLNAVYFENYWNAGSPQAQDRYFDNIVVSSQRIGCQ